MSSTLAREPLRARTRRTRRFAALALALAVLVLVALASLALGSRPVPLGSVLPLLLAPDGSADSLVLTELRIPRTVLGLLVGAALGLAGALMQALTRNPLADPGILGVNAGAAFAVVVAVALTGISAVAFSVWFALLGAGLASAGVFVLGSMGRQSATPARLALAGVAVAAALAALSQAVLLADQVAFNELRFWLAGSLEGRGWPVVATIAPFVLLGSVLALALGPALNAVALGDETGAALGVRVRRVRLGTMLATTALCGAATAAAGPIAFVGLAVPFVARALVGSDHRWTGLLCLVLGPAFLLGADVVARVVTGGQEIQVGIVTALVGAPVFVAVVRRRRIEAL